MIRRIDVIPSPVKLLIILGYDLAALSIAFFLSYFLRLGGDIYAFSFAELGVFVITVAFTLITFYFLEQFQK